MAQPCAWREALCDRLCDPLALVDILIAGSRPGRLDRKNPNVVGTIAEATSELESIKGLTSEKRRPSGRGSEESSFVRRGCCILVACGLQILPFLAGFCRSKLLI
jgi:hypothetical protein